MTDSDFAALLNPHLASTEAYTPIQPLDVLSQRLGIPVANLVKLDANENPYGPIPAVTEALANFPHYHIYPDPESHALREALAEFVGVRAESLLPGQGADELLDYLCRLFLSVGDAVINTPPTFGMYSFDARLQGADVLDVPRQADYSIDVRGIEQAVTQRAASGNGPVKLVFLTAPNNPTGNGLDDHDLTTLLQLPAMIVLDEAYVEFSQHPSRASWVASQPNLVVLRTFSKAAGIAGLRLGYGIFPLWVMPTLRRFKQPYNVNVAAAVAGIAALQHIDEIEAVVRTLVAERARLYELLGNTRFLEPVPGSQANFILCHVRGRDAHRLKQSLERRGVLVRHYAKTGLANCLRISVGRPDQTDGLVQALRQAEDDG